MCIQLLVSQRASKMFFYSKKKIEKVNQSFILRFVMSTTFSQINNKIQKKFVTFTSFIMSPDNIKIIFKIVEES